MAVLLVQRKRALLSVTARQEGELEIRLKQGGCARC